MTNGWYDRVKIGLDICENLDGELVVMITNENDPEAAIILTNDSGSELVEHVKAILKTVDFG